MSSEENLSPAQKKQLEDLKEKREAEAFEKRKQERLDNIKAERAKEAQLARREQADQANTKKNSPKKKPTSLFRRVAKVTYCLLFWTLTGLIAWYLSQETSDRYISKAEFTIIKDQKTQNISAAEVLGFATSGTSSDLQLVEKYIHSSDLLKMLEKELNLQDHYSDSRKDWFFRLTQNASLEERLEHYRARIEITSHEQANVVEIKVDAYEPQLAQKLNHRLIEETEKFINELNNNIAKQQKDLIKKELTASEKQLQDARAELLAIRKKFESIDPDKETSSRFALINSLRLKISEAEAKLQVLQVSSPNSPEIPDLHSIIKVHREEIEKERAFLTGKEKEHLNQLIIDQEVAEHQVILDQKKYDNNQQLLNRTHLETIAQSRFLSMLQKPLLPDEAVQPQRIYLACATLFIAFNVFIILRITGKSIMSH